MRAGHGLGVLMLVFATSCAGDERAEPSSRRAGTVDDREVHAPAGEGVICALGIYNAMAEVGRRCLDGQEPEFQAELDRTVSQIDEYVLRNSDTSRADLMAFKREQALLGEPEAEVCRPEPIGMYRHMASAGAASLRASTRQLLKRPGKPSWGDCL